VCHQSLDVSNDVDENSRKSIKAYLLKYPERAMVKFNKKQLIHTELNGRWVLAKVINIDASLVQLKFLDLGYKYTEWMYRGSNRLGLINNREKRIHCTVSSITALASIKKTLNQPYIELEHETVDNLDNKNYSVILINKLTSKNLGFIETIEIPLDSPSPVLFKDHQCNHFCMIWVKYNINQTKSLNTLSIPLHYGFKRFAVETEISKSKVIYITPCGRTINNENEMLNYLKITEFSEDHMTIDLFSFDNIVNPLAIFNAGQYFSRIHDTSYGMEFKPISVVNCLDESMPPEIEYITDRKIMPGVDLNLDMKFLCSCDCIDDCSDKTKCSCWKLTYESQNKFSSINSKDFGYQFRRLYKRMYMGIFECNTNCKCSKTCLNRVVQQPLSTMLQVFKTEIKGWGVRTLADIPKGSFICTYVGKLYAEKDAEMIANNIENGDEFLADLDYIEIVEELKDGYECDVVIQSKMESDTFSNCSFSSSSSNINSSSNSSPTSNSFKEDFNIDYPKLSICESYMSVGNKNIQHPNTKSDGSHQLSKLYTQSILNTN